MREHTSEESARKNRAGAIEGLRVLVCGSRSWSDYAAISDQLSLVSSGVGLVVVHGGAMGADTVAANYALRSGIPTEVFYADWDKYGKRAGILRNNEMLDTRPDLVLAFWDGKSRGTKHTIDEARRRGIPCEVILARAACGAHPVFSPGSDGT